MIHKFIKVDKKNMPLKKYHIIKCFYRVRVLVFNTTFNNISVILWRSILLVEDSTQSPTTGQKRYSFGTEIL
jgi:hypothetical protein